MARCIPDVIPAAQHHDGEQALLERLRTELPDEFIVIPCLEVPHLRTGRDSEADFVILHPRGRLVLESKGGEIRCVQGRWERKKSGKWQPLHPPFFQARDNSYEIREHLKRTFGKEAPEAKMPFGHVVVFPSIDFNVETIEMPDARLIDRTELANSDMVKIMHRLLEDTEQRYLTRFPGQSLPAPLTDAQLLAVANKLRPEIRVTTNLTPEALDRQLIRLSSTQLRALDAAAQSKRLRIVGGPGSGKTLLALEVCRRELAANPALKIGLVCFNRYLGAFLVDVAKADRLTSVTPGSFYLHLDRILGDVADAKATDPAYFQQRVRAALEIAQRTPEAEKFDLLVVDEGQDFRDDGDKLALFDAILKGGLAKGRWRWFEDLDQILSPEATTPPSAAHQALLDCLDAYGQVEVACNWRNTEQIAQAAAKVMGRPTPPSFGVQGPKVTPVDSRPGRDFDLLVAVLGHDKLRAYRPEDIIVLSMKGAGKESFAGKAEAAGYRLVPYDANAPYEEGTLRTSTVFKFKGMESHVVILMDVDALATTRDRRKAYVGMTRAKYDLYVLGQPEALALIRG
jgi:Nuclease-related domain/UvrD-like helicase C-terminal domain